MTSLLVNILESFLGETRKHNEDTGQIAFDCPACSAELGLSEGDGKGNLEINYTKGVFKCWSCQETNNMHGPVTKLLKKYGSPKILRDYLLIKPDADSVIVKEHINIEVKLPEGYTKLAGYSGNDFNAKLALKYLYRRGITDDIIKEFDIGYTIHGDFYNRIIIPSYDSEGKFNYFIARWFSTKYNKLKYINPTAEKQEIVFNEGKVNWDATIYLVEGATDHIVTPNSIPLLGKFISPMLLDLLYYKSCSNIVIVLDDDAYEDAIRLFRELNFGDLRGRIRVVKSPIGYDPSKIFEKLGPKGIVSLLGNARILSGIEAY